MVPEVDLHGLDLEEALAEVERELNHTFVQELEDRRLCFITGWGPVLRPQIQNYLCQHPLVREIRAEGPSLQIILEDLTE
jgi:DNA-nicking Smr family endonuclease